MPIRTLFLFLAPLLLKSSAAPPPVSQRAAEVRFADGRAAREIPIEIAGEGLAFVSGQVRGSQAWLLLDTGSPSVLSTRLATKLGLVGEEENLGGGENRVAVRHLKDVPVQLPGVEIRQPEVSSFALDALQTALGHKIDGILGASFFDRLVVEIDFERKTLSLRDPKTYRWAGKGKPIALTLEEGLPYVRAKVALAGRPPLEGSFLLDTGADNALILFSPFVDEHELLGPGAKALPDAGAAAGGSLEAVLRGERVEVGPFLLRGPVLHLSRSTTGRLADRGHAGLIGGEALSRFRVTLDYPRSRVILEENARYADSFEYDASGLTLRAQGPDLSAFAIRRIAPSSPGAAAGLVVGDVLLAVDGRPVKEIGLQGVRKLLQKEGEKYVLTVFRGGRIRRFPIMCQRQL